MVVGTPRMQSGLSFFMAKMSQYILKFHNNCDQGCSYNSRHDSYPVETPCQEDVWWNGHMPPHILKIRTEGPASCYSLCIVRYLQMVRTRTAGDIKCHLKVHDHAHNSPPPQPILRQNNPVYTFTLSFKDSFKINKLFSVDHNYFIH